MAKSADGNGSGGLGDPPINYSGPGAAIGDNVFNLLPELCLNCDSNDEPETNFTIYGHDPSGDRTGRDGTITHSIESDDFSSVGGGAKTGNILAEFIRVLVEALGLYNEIAEIPNKKPSIDENVKEETPTTYDLSINKIVTNIPPQGNTHRVTPRVVVGQKDSTVLIKDLPKLLKINATVLQKADSLKKVYGIK